MRHANILNECLRLNRLCNNGWVTISAHPVYGIGRWVVRIEHPSNDDHVIGTDTDLAIAIKEAEANLKA